MKSVLVGTVEELIEEYYSTVRISPEEKEALMSTMNRELQTVCDNAKQDSERLFKEKEKLVRMKQKLLEAHYADAIDLETLRNEQKTISVKMERIQLELDLPIQRTDEAKQRLVMALDLLENIGKMYGSAPDVVKKQMNQIFFTKIYVRSNDAISTEHAPVFERLLGVTRNIATKNPSRPTMGRAGLLRNQVKI
jgi:hypothetical protein